MQVVVNDAISQRGPSGSARAADMICSALAELGHDVTRLRPPQSRHPIARMLRFAFWDFYGPARQDGDLVVSPSNTGRAGRGRPHVLWLQDTMVLDRPDLFDRTYSSYARLAFPVSVRLATLIVVSSTYAQQQIIARWPRAARRVRMIPYPYMGQVAVGPRSGPRCPPEVLMLGATEPHKRHVLGIEAVRLARILSRRDIRLRIVGPAGHAEAQVAAARDLVDPSQVWIRRETLTSREAVDQTIEHADLLLQCSSMEGFCLPLVEAAARALPAIHTGCGAMQEVHPIGSANTSDAGALANEIVNCLDAARYREASAAGLSLMPRYAWSSFVDAVGRVTEEARATRSPAR